MPSVGIPMGSEFSPAVIRDFPRLLQMLVDYKGDRKALQGAIDSTFFPNQKAVPPKTLGDNTILSMNAYGLISTDPEHYQITDIGQRLIDLKNQPEDLDRIFAQHILINCKGLVMIEAIRDLMAAGIPLQKLTITKELARRGLHMSTNAKHANVLRQWLERFGILNTQHSRATLWVPDEKAIVRIIGLTVDDLDALSDLTPEQRDFARALALIDEDNVPSNQVRDHALALYGTEFSEGGLPQSVLYKLEEIGLITWAKTTGGRGAKPHTVSPTAKLRNSLLVPVMDAMKNSIGANYKKIIRMRFADILRDLSSQDTHVKGLALEALAVRLALLLDLTFIKWRHRSAETGGAEVDAIVEGARFIFSRWQIQCKNAKSAAVDQLAKEVGVAVAMRTNVIMFVCTGAIGSAVRTFARTVMENTPMQIILLGHAELAQISSSPASIAQILNDQAHQAMEIKRVQIEGTSRGIAP
jgi:hypothetical protein